MLKLVWVKINFENRVFDLVSPNPDDSDKRLDFFFSDVECECKIKKKYRSSSDMVFYNHGQMFGVGGGGGYFD